MSNEASLLRAGPEPGRAADRRRRKGALTLIAYIACITNSLLSVPLKNPCAAISAKAPKLREWMTRHFGGTMTSTLHAVSVNPASRFRRFAEGRNDGVKTRRFNRQATARRLLCAKKREQQRNDGGWPLHMRDMPGVGDDLQPGVWQVGRQALATVERDELVPFAPDQKRGD